MWIITELTLGRQPGGADCSDPTWAGIPQADIVAFYSSSKLGILIAGGLMIVVGTALLVRLYQYEQRAMGSVALPAILVILAMMGYGLLSYTATLLSPC